MAMKIFNQLNFKNEKMPKSTGLGGRTIRPSEPLNLADPSFFVSNHAGIKRNLQRFDLLDPKQMRAESLEQVNQAVDKVNAHISSSMQFKGLRFDVHEESGRTFAVVRDQQTGEVLKTIPGEAMLEIAGRLQDISGILVDVTG